MATEVAEAADAYYDDGEVCFGHAAPAREAVLEEEEEEEELEVFFGPVHQGRERRSFGLCKTPAVVRPSATATSEGELAPLVFEDEEEEEEDDDDDDGERARQHEPARALQLWWRRMAGARALARLAVDAFAARAQWEREDAAAESLAGRVFEDAVRDAVRAAVRRERAARTIQSWARRRFGAAAIEECAARAYRYRDLASAAARIGRWRAAHTAARALEKLAWRASAARHILRTERRRRKDAARTLQRAWRSRAARQSFRCHLGRLRGAAGAIQRAWRSHAARRRLSRLRAERGGSVAERPSFSESLARRLAEIGGSQASPPAAAAPSAARPSAIPRLAPAPAAAAAPAPPISEDRQRLSKVREQLAALRQTVKRRHTERQQRHETAARRAEFRSRRAMASVASPASPPGGADAAAAAPAELEPAPAPTRTRRLVWRDELCDDTNYAREPSLSRAPRPILKVKACPNQTARPLRPPSVFLGPAGRSTFAERARMLSSPHRPRQAPARRVGSASVASTLIFGGALEGGAELACPSTPPAKGPDGEPENSHAAEAPASPPPTARPGALRDFSLRGNTPQRVRVERGGASLLSSKPMRRTLSAGTGGAARGLAGFGAPQRVQKPGQQ